MDMDINNTNKLKIKDIILRFEKGEIPVNLAVEEINKIAKKEITEHYLKTYWRFENIDDFITKILIHPIKDWNLIDDKRALLLINEMIENISENSVFDRNAEALEKRYSKYNGALSNWIFQENITDSLSLLQKLKDDNVIRL